MEASVPAERRRDSNKWVDYVIATTPQGCIRRFSSNKSLIDNLGQVFAYVCQTLKILYNYGQCLHMFINRSLPEVDLLFLKNNHPCYGRLGLRYERYEALQQVTKSWERAGKNTDTPKVFELEPRELSELTGLLEVQVDLPEGEAGILVPFDFADLNLGLFVLWGGREEARGKQSPENEKLRGWVASIYFFMKEFLEREYIIVPQVTYLPSLYAARWKRAAILFADIRNFTPLSEILRNTYARPEKRETSVFRNILNKHCREMANIVQQDAQGRINRFFGPGVMAIFGEHEDNPSKAAASAVYAATRMVKHFQTLKLEFLRTAFGEGYETEYNESVGIELGVGIDFGTVLFEYLGDERHREYTVIGDHVNFAQRLEHEAMRVDETGRHRPPILISPTVERCTRPWIERKERMSIYEKKGFTYTVYGLTPEDFERDLFAKCMEMGDWTTPWKDAGLLQPA